MKQITADYRACDRFFIVLIIIYDKYHIYQCPSNVLTSGLHLKVPMVTAEPNFDFQYKRTKQLVIPFQDHQFFPIFQTADWAHWMLHYNMISSDTKRTCLGHMHNPWVFLSGQIPLSLSSPSPSCDRHLGSVLSNVLPIPTNTLRCVDQLSWMIYPEQ